MIPGSVAELAPLAAIQPGRKLLNGGGNDGFCNSWKVHFRPQKPSGGSLLKIRLGSSAEKEDMQAIALQNVRVKRSDLRRHVSQYIVPCQISFSV